MELIRRLSHDADVIREHRSVDHLRKIRQKFPPNFVSKIAPNLAF